jgi:hypothetical protein
MSADLTTGWPHYLSVTNEDWCGCAVWIDLNSDFNFDASENFFSNYQANVTNTYNVVLTIPNGTPVGSYRMRIISPWGSDGFTNPPCTNGCGPCGSYDYGGFQDFTINITGPQGIEDVNSNPRYINASLNRESNQIAVSVRDFKQGTGVLSLTDATGKNIETRNITNEKELMDASLLPAGIYLLSYFDGTRRQVVKLVK